MMNETTKRCLTWAKTIVFAALAATTLAGAASAQEVVVEGNRRVDSETIRSYVSGGAGSAEEARRNLLATNMFSDVRISRRGAQTIVVVRENQLINRVFFEGNSKIKKENLEPEIQSKTRGPFDQAAVDSDAQRIQAIYKRSGRGLATVTPRIVDLTNGRVDVIFKIDEGGKTGIREINFVGNNVYSSRRLRELMTSSEMNLLSFLKTSDIYDPDKISSDLELVRRYYLKNGYADFQVVSVDAQFDAPKEGYVLTITLTEGDQYRVADVRFDSRVPQLDPESLRKEVVTSSGDVYNAESVEKTVGNVTRAAARRGYAFTLVRPTGQRDPASRTVTIGYIVEEGPHVYIERINIRGNTRTRDYVIRRELDVGEGDPYNRVLMDRAERRLNNLGYFKKVRVSNEPGTSPDRVIVNIDVEDQPTGAFSVSGGYSTTDGFIGELSVSESNFLGRGQYVRLSGQLGERVNGVDFSFTEPYFLGYRLAAGFDLFSKYTDQTQYARYENRTTGGQLRLGLPITEDIGVTLRYSLYVSDLKIPNTLKKPYNDCSAPLPGYTILNPNEGTAAYPNCAYDGEASIAAKESQGSTLTSLAGVTLGYNTVDNLKNPRSGIYAELKPDVAGLGGDSKFARITGEVRYYRELYEDVVGLVKVQGGHIEGFGDTTRNGAIQTAGGDLRLTDQFFMGPSLVRGFRPSGIGPRDISSLDSNSNAVGGSTYYGGTLEVQFPIWGLPRDLGLKGAVFADAGTLFGYKGPTAFDANLNGRFEGGLSRDGVFTPDGGLCVTPSAVVVGTQTVRSVQSECLRVLDKDTLRSSVGASILWQSPLGPLRFDYAIALSKEKGTLVDFGQGPIRVGGDQTQAFRFSGGTRF